MLANLLAHPLLKADAIDREINAINSEFESCFADDTVRSEVLLTELVKDKTHPASIFGWGNLESLTKSGKQSLYDDVRKFHSEYYSADRMCVVVQTKLPTNQRIDTLKHWITQSFSVISNHNLGKQNFGIGRKLPYEDSLDEIVVFNSMKDYNAVSFVFNFTASTERMRLKTTFLIGDLL